MSSWNVKPEGLTISSYTSSSVAHGQVCCLPSGRPMAWLNSSSLSKYWASSRLISQSDFASPSAAQPPVIADRK